MKVQNKDFIKESEGLRLKAYLPTPNDRWTIGYGHTKGVTPNMVITKAQAEEFLSEDLEWVEDAIKRRVLVPLNQNQYDALASWIYNLGEGNLRISNLLRLLNNGDYEGAADEFLKWNKQRNKKTGQLEVLSGLTKRREKERELFLTPVSSTPPKFDFIQWLTKFLSQKR
jgi:lysozyme